MQETLSILVISNHSLSRLFRLSRGSKISCYPVAQPAEPPYADPHVRWCGRCGAAKPPPIPIRWHRAHLQAQAMTNSNTEKPVSAVHLRRLTAAILAVGYASAIINSLASGAASENPLGYEPLETKK